MPSTSSPTRSGRRSPRTISAQKRTEITMHEGFANFDRRLGVIGSRGDDGAEEAFRQGLLEHVRHLGYTVEHFHGQDPEGYIDSFPRSYDLDVLVQNGITVATEIKANASGADVTEFARRVSLFERQTGRKADRKIIVAVTIERMAPERAEPLGRRGIPFQPVPVVAGQKQALSPPILGYNFSMDFIPAFRLRARCGGIRRERAPASHTRFGREARRNRNAAIDEDVQHSCRKRSPSASPRISQRVK